MANKRKDLERNMLILKIVALILKNTRGFLHTAYYRRYMAVASIYDKKFGTLNVIEPFSAMVEPSGGELKTEYRINELIANIINLIPERDHITLTGIRRYVPKDIDLVAVEYYIDNVNALKEYLDKRYGFKKIIPLGYVDEETDKLPEITFKNAIVDDKGMIIPLNQRPPLKSRHGEITGKEVVERLKTRKGWKQ